MRPRSIIWLKMWREKDELTWRDGSIVSRWSFHCGELDAWAALGGGVDRCVTLMNVKDGAHFVRDGLCFLSASSRRDLSVVHVVVCTLLRRCHRLLRSAQVLLTHNITTPRNKKFILGGGVTCFLPYVPSVPFIPPLTLTLSFSCLKVAHQIQLSDLGSDVSSPARKRNLQCHHKTHHVRSSGS